MEFRFNVNEVFRQPIVQVGPTLIPQGFKGDRRTLWDAVSKVTDVVNAMGTASAAAQGLTKPITSADRLRNSENQQLYLLIDPSAHNGKGAVTGLLKTGQKGLYVFDREGHHYHVQSPCVLDFYVHESRQRSGYGKTLFEHMLQKEEVLPEKLAIDRPSEKFLEFLKKHYDLQSPIRQMNNYVVYDGFFPDVKDTDQQQQQTTNNNSTSPNKNMRGSNGLQQQIVTSPYGRYGAPRPACSMGQIIHNQSAAVSPQEPTGLNIRVEEPRLNHRVRTTPNPPSKEEEMPREKFDKVAMVGNGLGDKGPIPIVRDEAEQPKQLRTEYYWPFAKPTEEYPSIEKQKLKTKPCCDTIHELISLQCTHKQPEKPQKIPIDERGQPVREKPTRPRARSAHVLASQIDPSDKRIQFKNLLGDIDQDLVNMNSFNKKYAVPLPHIQEENSTIEYEHQRQPIEQHRQAVEQNYQTHQHSSNQPQYYHHDGQYYTYHPQQGYVPVAPQITSEMTANKEALRQQQQYQEQINLQRQQSHEYQKQQEMMQQYYQQQQHANQEQANGFQNQAEGLQQDRGDQKLEAKVNEEVQRRNVEEKSQLLLNQEQALANRKHALSSNQAFPHQQAYSAPQVQKQQALYEENLTTEQNTTTQQQFEDAQAAQQALYAQQAEAQSHVNPKVSASQHNIYGQYAYQQPTLSNSQMRLHQQSAQQDNNVRISASRHKLLHKTASKSQLLTNPLQASASKQSLGASQKDYSKAQQGLTTPQQTYSNAQQEFATPQQAQQKDYSTAQQGLNTPQQAYSTAQQGLATPQQAYSTAQQGLAVPQQTYSTAQQVLVAPQQAYSTAQQGLTTPQQAYSTGQQLLATPQQAYVIAQQGQATSPQGFASPQQAYSTAQQGLVTPQQAYSAAQQGLATPQQAYLTAQQGLVTPQQAYSAAQQGLATPQQAYLTAQQGLATPQQVYSTTQQTSQPDYSTTQGGLATTQSGYSTAQQGLTAAQQGLITSQQEMSTPRQVVPTDQQDLSSSQQVWPMPQQGHQEVLVAPQQGLSVSPQQVSSAPQQGVPAPQQVSYLPQQVLSAPQQAMSYPQQAMSQPQPVVSGSQQVLPNVHGQYVQNMQQNQQESVDTSPQALASQQEQILPVGNQNSQRKQQPVPQKLLCGLQDAEFLPNPNYSVSNNVPNVVVNPQQQAYLSQQNVTTNPQQMYATPQQHLANIHSCQQQMAGGPQNQHIWNSQYNPQAQSQNAPVQLKDVSHYNHQATLRPPVCQEVTSVREPLEPLIPAVPPQKNYEFQKLPVIRAQKIVCGPDNSQLLIAATTKPKESRTNVQHEVRTEKKMTPTSVNPLQRNITSAMSRRKPLGSYVEKTMVVESCGKNSKFNLPNGTGDMQPMSPRC